MDATFLDAYLSDFSNFIQHSFSKHVHSFSKHVRTEIHPAAKALLGMAPWLPDVSLSVRPWRSCVV